LKFNQIYPIMGVINLKWGLRLTKRIDGTKFHKGVPKCPE